MNLGCGLIVFWQIVIIVGAIVLGKKLVPKQSMGILRVFYIVSFLWQHRIISGMDFCEDFYCK